MKKLFSGRAGTWPNVGGNANLVPVVANGEVFVGSNKQLHIFGLNKTPGLGMRPRCNREAGGPNIRFSSQAFRGFHLAVRM